MSPRTERATGGRRDRGLRRDRATGRSPMIATPAQTGISAKKSKPGLIGVDPQTLRSSGFSSYPSATASRWRSSAPR